MQQPAAFADTLREEVNKIGNFVVAANRCRDDVELFQLLAETLPDFALAVAIRASTLVTVVVMGIVAVTLAPLLTARRMRRMDLPGTLRLVE